MPVLKVVNNGNGIGDQLLGLLATSGVKRKFPQAHVVYGINLPIRPWIELFDGYDELVDRAHKTHCDKEYHINNSYKLECNQRGKVARYDLYCQIADHCTPTLPKLKQPLPEPRIKGACILAPHSCYGNREWSGANWNILEEQFRKEGRRVLILSDRADRCNKFKSERLVASSADNVASHIYHAEMFVGIDSGLTHVAGLCQASGSGVKAIALFGATKGASIFGAYPAIHCVQGKLKQCDGCYWHAEIISDICWQYCASMEKIHPDEVFNLAMHLTGCKQGSPEVQAVQGTNTLSTAWQWNNERKEII